jgi:PAS domain S-box-containing protein
MEAEEALRQSENRLRLVIGTIPTMAWSLLPDGTVDFVNQRWLEYTGLSLEEALADSIRTIHPEDAPRVMEKWRRDMAAGEQCEYEIRLRRADGEYRWFLVRTVPLRDEQGNIVKWYGTSTDITERRNAENALRDFGVQLQALNANLRIKIAELETEIATLKSENATLKGKKRKAPSGARRGRQSSRTSYRTHQKI